MHETTADEVFLFEGIRLNRRAEICELVSKNEIMTTLWPGIIVKDSNLPTLDPCASPDARSGAIARERHPDHLQCGYSFVAAVRTPCARRAWLARQ
jgi:hypothetical protein